jgi:hypothetical protein
LKTSKWKIHSILEIQAMSKQKNIFIQLIQHEIINISEKSFKFQIQKSFKRNNKFRRKKKQISII